MKDKRVQKRIQKALKEIRENRSKYPPKVEVDGHHIKIGGGGDRLKEDFKSSGLEDK